MSNAASPLGWLGIARIGIVQACLGAVVVLVISTLNRIMVVEYSLPAALPGALVALHYAVQMLRPRFGYGSDQGGKRTSWVLGGMAVLSSGAVLCAIATTWISARPIPGLFLAVFSYVLVGLGVGAAGTSLLVMLAQQVDDRRRAAAATIMWILMIAGFAVTSTIVGHFLDPYSPSRLVMVMACAAAMAFVVAFLAIWGVENQPLPQAARSQALLANKRSHFLVALREVWSEPEARAFTLFVFISMLAYSAEELLIEPFAGLIFRYTPGQSASLAGLQHMGVLLGMVAVGIACTGGRRLGSLRSWTIGGCLASALSLLSLIGANFVGPSWPPNPNAAA